MAQHPKVSALLITYNHEEFIGQALDSVLVQQATFGIEVVVGEDQSTDQTAEVVATYSRTHSDKLRPIFRPKNVGMNRNFAETYLACRGEYIAFLEGDDFWTDPRKLQIQADYLDLHPDVAMCFHNGTGFCVGNSMPDWDLVPARQKQFSFLVDLLRGWCMPTCTTMVRRCLLDTFPDWFYPLGMGEWPFYILLMLNAPRSKIAYIPRYMARYRRHGGGIWSTLSSSRANEKILRAVRAMRQSLPKEYIKYTVINEARCLFHLGKICQDEGEEERGREFLAQFRGLVPRVIFMSLIGRGMCWRELCSMLTRLYAPRARGSLNAL